MSLTLAGCVVVLVGCLPLFSREGAALPHVGVSDDRPNLHSPNQVSIKYIYNKVVHKPNVLLFFQKII